ncbi:type II secretion system protein [Kiritimatiella glycovorans]|uniref:Prepilin-type N-terminal cleavage/methylation domain-containing protein n=1 Tax=Kiritimatiella glycovorans TaxID=1307763 RepID=A0A0G3EHB3_9BACT|nr:prepilin-type N-terminal cleavage/methylation domain-containing protein [Kiritimatiella glycovorans]AKJ63554.1 hypothetical protein L21SP4_00273 [Kiritimatiella glycovorans]
MYPSTRKNGGFTLVEVMVSIGLIGTVVAIFAGAMITAYRSLTVSRGRLDAQGIAFDRLWEVYQESYESLQDSDIRTPEYSSFSTNGWVRVRILPHTDHREIVVQVWAPRDMAGRSALAGVPAAEFRVLRYPGERLE